MHFPDPNVASSAFYENYPVGVIVGRFQLPELHDAHMTLIKTVVERHDATVVVLGVATTLGSKRNPLDFESRRSMINAAFPEVIVIAQPDNRDDEQWSRDLDKRIREVTRPRRALLYGGRDSFIPHYTGSLDTTELEQNVYISGSMIRERAACLARNNADFRAGVVYGTNNRFDVALSTVDIVPVRATSPAGSGDSEYSVLLAKKPGEKQLRMVGGFVDPSKDMSKRDAALRELHEEVGINFEVDPDSIKFVTEGRVDDWRYRNETDKIFTTVFVVTYSYGTPVPKDDIEHVEWVPVGSCPLNNIVPEHRKFVKQVLNYINK